MCTVDLETLTTSQSFLGVIYYNSNTSNQVENERQHIKDDFGNLFIPVVTVDPIPLHILSRWQDPEES